MRSSTVLKYMENLHGWVLLASAIISCVAAFGVFDPFDLEYELGRAQLGSQERFAFEFMSAGSSGIMVFLILGTHGFFFLLFSVLAWIIRPLS